jgi:hypothetical protein
MLGKKVFKKGLYRAPGKRAGIGFRQEIHGQDEPFNKNSEYTGWFAHTTYDF